MNLSGIALVTHILMQPATAERSLRSHGSKLYLWKVFTLIGNTKHGRLHAAKGTARVAVTYPGDPQSCHVRSIMVSRIMAALFLLLLFGGMGHSQQLNFGAVREQVISLDGLWRFCAGDDPRWADPSFDDRNWSLLRADKGWGSQGYRGYNGMGWYRITVENTSDQPLSVMFGPITDSYQVFVNGRMIGEMGKMPPHPASYGEHPAVFRIAPKQTSRTLLIAIRVWKNSAGAFVNRGGFIHGGSLLGTPALVEGRYHAIRTENMWSQVVNLVTQVLIMLAGLTALSLFLIGHAESEYLWYALAQLNQSAISFLWIYALSVPFPDHVADLIGLPLMLMLSTFIVLFYCRIFQVSRGWLFWCVLLGRIFESLCGVLLDFGDVSTTLYLITEVVTQLLFICWVTWAAWRGVLRGLLDARLLIWPLLANNLVGLIVVSNYYLRAIGLRVPEPIARLNSGFDWGPVHLFPSSITELLVLLATLAVLVGRFARTRRDEERHARELESARALQHMLIPNEVPALPAFSIASVYEPAQEVGGDFFQIIPLNQGVLVAIGDVSGKGIAAAMTVSLIVGALRTLVEQTQSPSAILGGLNRRLIGRSSGFTTCLIALLDSSGRAMLANAGHLSPYLNGEELQTVSNLPLGLSDDTLYLESPLVLRSEDRFTFVSDGVVEARNEKGELFGFDRTSLHSTQTADAIAAAAKQFGQEDDITVLTIKYQAFAAISHAV